MRTFGTVSIFSSLGFFLMACSTPQMEAITVEPVYDKYGSVSEAACRPEGSEISTYYPERLQTCESLCEAGYSPSYNGTSAVTEAPQCVQIPHQYDPNRDREYPDSPGGYTSGGGSGGNYDSGQYLTNG